MDELDPNWKEVLHDLSGFVKPGEMLAVMGASGSGNHHAASDSSGRLGIVIRWFRTWRAFGTME